MQPTVSNNLTLTAPTTINQTRIETIPLTPPATASHHQTHHFTNNDWLNKILIVDAAGTGTLVTPATSTATVLLCLCRLLSTHDLIHLRQISIGWMRYLQQRPEAWVNSDVQLRTQPVKTPPAAMVTLKVITQGLPFLRQLQISPVPVADPTTETSSTHTMTATSTPMTDQELSYLIYLQHLERLILSNSNCFVNPSVVFRQLFYLSNLNELELQDPFFFTPQNIKMIGCLKIHRLDIHVASSEVVVELSSTELIEKYLIQLRLTTTNEWKLTRSEPWMSFKKLEELDITAKFPSDFSMWPRKNTREITPIYTHPPQLRMLSLHSFWDGPPLTHSSLATLFNEKLVLRLEHLSLEFPSFPPHIFKILTTSSTQLLSLELIQLKPIRIKKKQPTKTLLNQPPLLDENVSHKSESELDVTVGEVKDDVEESEVADEDENENKKNEQEDDIALNDIFGDVHAGWVARPFWNCDTNITPRVRQLIQSTIDLRQEGFRASAEYLGAPLDFQVGVQKTLTINYSHSGQSCRIKVQEGEMFILPLELRMRRMKAITPIRSTIHDDTWAAVTENEWKQLQISESTTRPDQFGFYTTYFHRFEPTLIQVDHDENDLPLPAAASSDEPSSLVRDPTFAQSMTCMPEYAHTSFEELRLNGEFDSQYLSPFEVTPHWDVVVRDGMDNSLPTVDVPGQCQSMTCQPAYESTSFEEIRLHGELLARKIRPRLVQIDHISLTNLLLLSTEMRQTLRYLKLDIGGRSYNYGDTFAQLFHRFPNLLSVELGEVTMSRPMISNITGPTLTTSPLTESLEVTDKLTTTRISFLDDSASKHFSYHDARGWGGYEWTVPLKSLITASRLESPILELAHLKWQVVCSIIKKTDAAVASTTASSDGVKPPPNLNNEINLKESIKQIHQVRLQALLQTPTTSFLDHSMTIPTTVQVELVFDRLRPFRRELNLSNGKIGSVTAPKSDHWDAIIKAQSFQVRANIYPSLAYRPYQSQRNDQLLQQLISPINLCADRRFDFIRKLKIYEGFKLTDYELELTKKLHQTSYYARMNEQRRDIDPHPFWNRPHPQLISTELIQSPELESGDPRLQPSLLSPNRPMEADMSNQFQTLNLRVDSTSITTTAGFSFIAGDVITMIAHYLPISSLVTIRHLSHHWSHYSRLPRSWSFSQLDCVFGRWLHCWSIVECLQRLVTTLPYLRSIILPSSKECAPNTDLTRMGEMKYLQRVRFRATPEASQFLLELKNLNSIEFMEPYREHSLNLVAEVIANIGELNISHLLLPVTNYSLSWPKLKCTSLLESHLTLLRITESCLSGTDMTRFEMLEELQLHDVIHYHLASLKALSILPRLRVLILGTIPSEPLEPQSIEALLTQATFAQRLEYLSLKSINLNRTTLLRIMNECTALLGLELFFGAPPPALAGLFRSDRFLPITSDEWMLYQHHSQQPHIGTVNGDRSALITEQRWWTRFSPLLMNDETELMPVRYQSITSQPEYQLSSFEEIRLSGELECQQIPVEGKQIRIFESDEIDLMTLLTANERLRNQLLYLRLQSSTQDIWPSPGDLHRTHLQLIHRFPSLITSQLNDASMTEDDRTNSRQLFPWMRPTQSESHTGDDQTPAMIDSASTSSHISKAADGSIMIQCGMGVHSVKTTHPIWPSDRFHSLCERTLMRAGDLSYSDWIKKLKQIANKRK